MPTARPTTGLPPGVHLGPTGPRLLAALVEVGPIWLLAGVAVVFVVLPSASNAVSVVAPLLALAWAVFVWFRRASRAAGPGMRMDGLQIVGFRDGRPIGWGRVLLRALVFTGLTLSVVGLVAMLVVMARHPRRQGWHDRVADAVVIRERPLAPPRPRPAVARAGGSERGAPARRPPAGGPRRAPAARPGQPGGRPTTAGAARPAATLQDERPTRVQAPADSADATGDADEVPGADTAVGGDAAGRSEHAAGPSEDAAGPSENAAEASEDADEAADAQQPQTEWWLRLDDGRQVGVEGVVLLGRNPQPRVGEEDATLIKVADDTRTVSKSHLAVGVDARGLYAMDRGSTNGTTVTGPDAERRPCAPGDLVDVPEGSVISFGDHWLEVHRRGH